MSTKQKRVLWPLLIISCVTLSVIVAANTRGRSESVSKTMGAPQTKAATMNAGAATPNALNSAVPQGRLLRGPVQNVRFTLYDAGIFPSEVRVSAGQVAIHLEDVSGNSTGLVVIDGTSRLTLGQVVRRSRHWRGGAQITLGPGHYEVFDASRPANRARLIVEP